MSNKKRSLSGLRLSLAPPASAWPMTLPENSTWSSMRHLPRVRPTRPVSIFSHVHCACRKPVWPLSRGENLAGSSSASRAGQPRRPSRVSRRWHRVAKMSNVPAPPLTSHRVDRTRKVHVTAKPAPPTFDVATSSSPRSSASSSAAAAPTDAPASLFLQHLNRIHPRGAPRGQRTGSERDRS